jgi:hypothetical protein
MQVGCYQFVLAYGKAQKKKKYEYRPERYDMDIPDHIFITPVIMPDNRTDYQHRENY